jgi:hypothetical protein
MDSVNGTNIDPMHVLAALEKVFVEPARDHAAEKPVQ